MNPILQSYPCAQSSQGRSSASRMGSVGRRIRRGEREHEGALLCAKIDDTDVDSPSVVSRIAGLMDRGGDLDHEETTYHGC